MKDTPITGKKFLQWLYDLGVIPAGTRRVVIDAPHDGALMLYVESFGSDRIIKAEPPPVLHAATIQIIDVPAGDEDDAF